jgi:hypothetical protein
MYTVTKYMYVNSGIHEILARETYLKELVYIYIYCDVHAVGQQSTVETLVYNRC